MAGAALKAAQVERPAQGALLAARDPALDGLRGLIIVVMALDHANAFIARAHPAPEFWSGPFPAYDGALPFLTRAITHLAAPGFFFLMGIGVTLLAASRQAAGWSRGAITRFLATRGAVLVALQFLVENPAWQLEVAWRGGPFAPYFGVLYGLGGAMIACALLWRLPTGMVLAVSAGLVLLTQTAMPATSAAPAAPLAAHLLLVPAPGGAITVYYPVLPWLAVAAAGLAFGRALIADRSRAYRPAWWIGVGLLGAFVVLRVLGGFGNLRGQVGDGWIAFLNVVKYPPSLVFLLGALGLDLIALSLFARRLRPGPLAVFGASPLLFYVAHLYLYALVGLVVAPTSQTVMYAYWLVGLAVLYPACAWYAAFKERTPLGSLWRLF